jgi:hypothetical protein
MKSIYLILMAAIILFPIPCASSELNKSHMAPSPSLSDYSNQGIKKSVVPLTDIIAIKAPFINISIFGLEKYKFYENSLKPFDLQSMRISDASDRWKNIGVSISHLSSAPRSLGDSIKFVGRPAELNSNNVNSIGISAWNINWSQPLNDEMHNPISEGFDFVPSISSVPSVPNNFRDTEYGIDARWGYG